MQIKSGTVQHLNGNVKSVMPDGSLHVPATKYRIEGLKIGYGRPGYRVTLNGLNVMPNRLEFTTIDEAMRAIRCLEYVGHEPALFWDVWCTWPAADMV